MVILCCLVNILLINFVIACNKYNLKLGSDGEFAKCCECDEKYHVFCCRVRASSVWKKLSEISGVMMIARPKLDPHIDSLTA